MIWVLDASVATKWFFLDEPRRDQALRVRARLAAEPHAFVVPHLFFSGVLHVLSRKTGRDGGFCLRAQELLRRLGLRTLALSSSAWERAVTMTASGLSGYDATYAALAESVEGRWLTADVRATRKLSDHTIATLDEW